jgi:hypothetical protein
MGVSQKTSQCSREKMFALGTPRYVKAITCQQEWLGTHAAIPSTLCILSMFLQPCPCFSSTGKLFQASLVVRLFEVDDGTCRSLDDAPSRDNPTSVLKLQSQTGPVFHPAAGDRR